MDNGLEDLSKFKKYLMKHYKHLNTGKSPVFISISLIVGIVLVTGGAFLALKTTTRNICIGISSITSVMNAIQLIYKKYI